MRRKSIETGKRSAFPRLTTNHGLLEHQSYVVGESLNHGQRKNILVEMEDDNNIENKHADHKKSNSFLHSSGNLLKTECEQLKKKLFAVFVNSECNRRSSSKQVKPLSFASRPSKSSNFWKTRKKSGNPEFSKKEILDAEIPMSLSTQIFMFFDKCLRYAHAYISEVCNG